jgi:hypothetical protein
MEQCDLDVAIIFTNLKPRIHGQFIDGISRVTGMADGRNLHSLRSKCCTVSATLGSAKFAQGRQGNVGGVALLCVCSIFIAKKSTEMEILLPGRRPPLLLLLVSKFLG